MPSVRRMVKKVFPSTRLKKFENAVIIEIMKDEWLEMMEVDAFSLCLESVHTDSTMPYFEWRECFHPVKK